MSEHNLDNDRKSARRTNLRENSQRRTTSISTKHFIEKNNNEEKSVGIIGIVEHYLTDRLVPSFMSQQSVNIKGNFDYDFQFNVELLLVRQNLEAAVRKKLCELDLPGSAIDAGVRAVISSAFSESVSKSDLPIVLPEKKVINGQTFFCTDGREPIPLYGDREDKDEDAISFYERHWRPFEKAGLLYRNNLNNFNNSLVSAIRYLCQRRGVDAENFLPPSKNTAIEDEILKSGLSENDIKRIARYIDRKRSRVAQATEPSF